MTVTPLSVEKRAGTRERILRFLMKNQHTIEILAEKLEMTQNAVRSQIALLQREGIVEIQGEVKGTRRPAALYGMASGADVHFSKAYPVVLSHLVKVLARRVPAKEFKTVMKDVGKAIADSMPRAAGTARERVAGAVNVLKSMGSHADVIEEKGKLVIMGHGCPISRAVTADVRSCLAMESFLGRLTGLPVAERCNHSERPSCRFEITLPPKGQEKS
jgi:predicted ArsR family transcriptional regulator